MSALKNTEFARFRAVVSGRVQGVFYRASAATQAQRLGIAGCARNLPDGSVELLAEGNRVALESFLAWAKQGPPRARVAHITIEWSEFTGEFHDFSIH